MMLPAEMEECQLHCKVRTCVVRACGCGLFCAIGGLVTAKGYFILYSGADGPGSIVGRCEATPSGRGGRLGAASKHDGWLHACFIKWGRFAGRSRWAVYVDVCSVAVLGA